MPHVVETSRHAIKMARWFWMYFYPDIVEEFTTFLSGPNLGI